MGAEFGGILKGAPATFLRVNVSLVLASVWTIPVGVAIGFHRGWRGWRSQSLRLQLRFRLRLCSRFFCSPWVRIGGGMGIGSIALMLLGTQWYILFNVIAGAMAIPSDLKEVAKLFHFTTAQRWKTLILPGIFPFLITGLSRHRAERGSVASLRSTST